MFMPFAHLKGVTINTHGIGIRLDPDEDNFNLERDFGILLDAPLRFFAEAGDARQ
tara:strand:+ start:289 stop:453 length:165 start_codon:yes stop_codon:yes gene_type:complete